jgi:outer membrane receptor protein involved in Fe transport
MRIARWMMATLALAVAAPGLFAQGVTTGAVSGTITNEGGVALVDVQVQVLSKSTGFVSGVLSKANGRYIVPGLEPGTYTITIRRIGFQPVSRTTEVSLSLTTREDFRLTARAAVLAGVEVLATQSSAISPTRTGAQTTVSDSLLRRLPTLNRNFTDFVALTPQISTTGPGLSGGGTNNRFNNIQIDGSTEADVFGLGSTGQPGGQANGKSIGIESVKEYQVLLSPYDVRQGNFSGVLINAVTKSGTNEFHGAAYGVGRNQSFTRSQPYITDFKQQQYGLALGGPIVKDKVLFFVNPEFQTRVTPAGGIYVGADNVSLTQSSVDRFNAALAKYGQAPGSGGIANNNNPLANVFGRLDFNLPNGNQLVVRHNYGHAEDDNLSRSTFGFRLGSNAYSFKSDKNATVAQLRTLFGSGAYNELFLNYTTIRDKRAPAVRGPQITALDGGFSIVGGSERFSQGNELDQDIAELTDNYSFNIGNGHRITLGTQNQFFKFRNLFTQASYGVYNFGSLDSLEAGLPNQYIIGVPLSGDGAVRFTSAQYAAYAEDEWAFSNTLTFNLGLRLDVPTFGDKPPFNQSIQDSLGRNTRDIPSGNIQYSPRFGFNWDATGNQMNQVRGGVGLFTGRPAFVWLSNAFQNSGSVGVGVLTCSNSKTAVIAPPLTSANASAPPQSCLNGLSARAGGEIDLLSKDLNFPQNLRTTLGYDHRFAERWIATFEGIYTRGINNPFYTNVALAGIQGVNRFGRTIYGTDANKPVQKHTDRNQIFDVQNASNDYSYQLTAGLQRRYFNNFEASAFYTYSHAVAAQDLTSSTAFSQYRFGRAWAGDQNDTRATRSIFEQKHRIVANGTYSFPTRTDVSLIYFGQSGTPYDYVDNGDPNGDGVTLNDPLYIPKNASDPTEIQFQTLTSGGKTYTVADQQAAFDKFISGIDCLNSQRGQIMARNSCDNPWTNQLNVAIRQSLRTVGFQNVSLQLDIINFTNLLNKNWGLQPSAGFGSQSLLTYRTKTGTNLVNGQPVYTFDPTYQRFFSNFLSSNYQLQLQARYSF